MERKVLLIIPVLYLLALASSASADQTSVPAVSAPKDVQLCFWIATKDPYQPYRCVSQCPVGTEPQLSNYPEKGAYACFAKKTACYWVPTNDPCRPYACKSGCPAGLTATRGGGSSDYACVGRRPDSRQSAQVAAQLAMMQALAARAQAQAKAKAAAKKPVGVAVQMR